MKKYSFKGINYIYVLGSSHEDFKYFFSDIKNGLNVKEEDIEKAHPKELERIARLKAREQATTMRTLRGHNGIRFNPPQWDEPILKSTKNRKGMAKFSNSIFIIAGDSGIGLNIRKNQDEIFETFNKILKYNNAFVLFIRGNHDDPEFFDGEKINYSNIKAIPDYSVIETDSGNILCIGGAISVDREWRKKQEERINSIPSSFKKRLYCEKEAPFFDADAIEDIVKNVKIDYVVSHSAPSFATPENNGIIDDWVEKDKALKEDIEHERLIMDKIFNVLSEHNMKPKYWAYGHFNNNHIEKRSNTIFRSISGMGFNPISIVWDVFMFISNEENNKKKLKASKMISKLSRFEDRPQDPEGGNGLLEEELRREQPEEVELNEEPDAPNNEYGFEAAVAANDNLVNTANIGRVTPINRIDYETLRRELNEYRTRNNGGRVYAQYNVDDLYGNIATLTTNAATTVAYTGTLAGNDVTTAIINNDEIEGHG